MSAVPVSGIILQVHLSSMSNTIFGCDWSLIHSCVTISNAIRWGFFLSIKGRIRDCKRQLVLLLTWCWNLHNISTQIFHIALYLWIPIIFCLIGCWLKIIHPHKYLYCHCICKSSSYISVQLDAGLATEVGTRYVFLTWSVNFHKFILCTGSF